MPITKIYCIKIRQEGLFTYYTCTSKFQKFGFHVYKKKEHDFNLAYMNFVQLKMIIHDLKEYLMYATQIQAKLQNLVITYTYGNVIINPW
jgi:uncharacterized protein YlbG (UPF0298 family)